MDDWNKKFLTALILFVFCERGSRDFLLLKAERKVFSFFWHFCCFRLENFFLCNFVVLLLFFLLFQKPNHRTAKIVARQHRLQT